MAASTATAPGTVTYFPPDHAIPSPVSRVTFSLATAVIGYLMFRSLTSPNPNPEWSTSSSTSESPTTTSRTSGVRKISDEAEARAKNRQGETKSRSESNSKRKSHKDFLGAPAMLLLVSILRFGIVYVVGLHALISLLLPSSISVSLSSSPSPSPSLWAIPPPPPPASFPRLNPVLFSWNAVSAAAYTVMGTACWVRLQMFSTLGSDFTFRLARPSRLVTTGVYAWCQHPSYTSGLLGVLGPSIWFGRSDGIIGTVFGPAFVPSTTFNEWIVPFWNGAMLLYLCVSSFLVMHTRILAEEAMLRQAFGKEWEAWHNRTARLVPFVF